MTMPDSPSAPLQQPPTGEPFKPQRSLLKDQVVEFLRDSIVSGEMIPGAKVGERELAEHLGISRVPVRDALMQLEAEGLVVSKPGGRCVIELTEPDVRELYQVRLALERLAVKLATLNTSPQNRTALLDKLQEMRDAFADRDARAYPRNDVEIHGLVWQQAGNRHLLNTLNSMVGPIFMFVARNAEQFDWGETLGLHEDLVHSINVGDVRAAEQSIEHHLNNALQRSLQVFQSSRQTAGDALPEGSA